MSKETSQKIKLIFGAISVTACIFCFVSFFYISKKHIKSSDSYTIDSTFDVTVNDTHYDDITLEGYKFPALKKGDRVTYSFTLPEKHIHDAILWLYVDHSATRVFIDDELAYELGSPESKMIGYGFITVDLPDDYPGKCVRVEMYTIENEGRTNLDTPVIYNYETFIRNYISENSFYLVIDIAIIVLCLTIMLISITFSKIMPSLLNLTFLSIAFFFMGVWEMCSYNLIFLFAKNLIVRGYLEYMSLYIGPFFLSLYFYIDFFKPAGKVVKNIYRGVVIAQGIFPVLAVILHVTDIVHIPAILIVCHVLLFANIFTVLTFLINQIRQKTTNHISMIVGLIIIIILAITDIVRFDYYKYFNRDGFEKYTSLLLVGFLFFFISLIIDFFINQRKSLLKAARAETMHTLAHVDMMTELANRRKCDELFAELDSSKEKYVLISFDLNYLKNANDTYGHHEGDRLIIDFADLLKSVCTDESLIAGRMGGDEFLIIMRNAEASDAEKLLKMMNENCAEINKTRKPNIISYAYGYCSGNEAGSVEEVYRIADERMYEHKKIIKRSPRATLNKTR